MRNFNFLKRVFVNLRSKLLKKPTSKPKNILNAHSALFDNDVSITKSGNKNDLPNFRNFIYDILSFKHKIYEICNY